MKVLLVILSLLLIAGCAGEPSGKSVFVESSEATTNMASAESANSAAAVTVSLASEKKGGAANEKQRFVKEVVSRFDEPWAMAFMPDGRLLVTEKRGKLIIVSSDGKKSSPVSGMPAVDYGGQGGLGDVIVHPDFANNNFVYLSYAEAGDKNTRGAAVARARLTLSEDGGSLEDLQVIWRQDPKLKGRGHYGHRLMFSPDGYLFIASGERQAFTPAQDMNQSLGKILRLNDDGSVPSDNPFFARGGVAAEIWSLGHRNPLGIAFAADGRLWNHEMGPAGGDELNLVKRGANYGYPIVSNGNHYDGRRIPDHDTRPEFEAPKITWTPVIAPAGFIIYSGRQFPHYQGDGFIGGLQSRGIVRVEFDGDSAREAERIDLGKRIREIEQGPDGAIWYLEDGNGGHLVKLSAP